MENDTFRSQFRLPYPLYESLKALAQKNGRSLNAELVARLQRSIEADDVLGGGDALDTAAYQAMAVSVLNKNIDHSGLSKDMEMTLSQLTRIGEKIISKMQFNKGSSDYVTSPIPTTKPDEQ